MEERVKGLKKEGYKERKAIKKAQTERNGKKEGSMDEGKEEKRWIIGQLKNGKLRGEGKRKINKEVWMKGKRKKNG